MTIESAEAQQGLRQIEAALQAGDIARAIDLAEGLLARGVEHPLLLNLVASRLEDQGRLEEGFRLLARAMELAPGDAFVLNAIGLNLDKQGRRPEAVRAFDAALAIEPAFPQAHHNRAQTLVVLGDFESARQGYQQAAAMAEGYADPLAGLASLAVRQGDLEAGRDWAAKALAIDPQHAVALSAMANVELLEGDASAAEARLRLLLENPGLATTDRPAVQALLGDALDRLGRIDEAFAAYSAGNSEAERLYAPMFGPGAGPTALDDVRRLDAYMRAAEPAPWAVLDMSDPGDAARHVFLLGFPRSGTTLLEQVLASHPDVVTMDERTPMIDAEQELLSSNPGLDRLARLEGEELKLFRDAYWGRIKAFGLDVRGKLFIDKFPLATTKLPAIAKLFPHARILFALRDPRDVVLSCFRRGFGMNAAMYQFVTLEGAARFYDAVMGFAQTCRGKLPLNLHEVRYEAVVEDFEPTARAAADFIGLDWTDALRDFAQTARSRPIRTPSASQVRRGLYSDAIQQWRRYQDHLAPALPVLEPWVERFGYPPE
jgi:tetratricopeptide (TPR) repeat protein